MRWIYISPHLDDAILSCGGLIREQTSAKIGVEIWTVFAGDPPEVEYSPLANRLHTEWGTGTDTPAVRRREDISACQKIGARYRHLSFLDCIYRQDKAGNWLYPEDGTIQSEVSPDDEPTQQTLQAFLGATLKPEDVVVCPLSVGRHVDHQLTRKACEKLNRPLLYYPDIPYLLNYPQQLPELTDALTAVPYPFSLLSFEAWLEAIQIYSSQLKSLFNDLNTMRSSLTNYYEINRGINLWKSTCPSCF